MAKFEIKPGAELDVLTRDELHVELQETISGYLRPPVWIRNPAGVILDGSGDGTVAPAYVVDAGMEFTFTRAEFFVDGYTAANPFTASSGGIDIYVDGTWRDGYPFSAGLLLPGTYTETQSKAIHCFGGAEITVVVTGGPASKGFSVAVCGYLAPLEPAS